MKTRLNRITTKTGDQGDSSLADGKRISKTEIIFEVLGDIDELNVVVGLLSNRINSENERTLCNWIQHKLFNFGGELSLPENKLISSADIEYLEQNITHYNASLAPLTEFVLPNGNLPSIHAHLARTVCRRAERHLCHHVKEKHTQQNLLIFLNRLSDLFFVLARFLSLEIDPADSNQFHEEQWSKPK